ncbi:hypothetical protein [Serinicoccus sp. LYQ131]|uniref:hypothetical protein n=1 Tax=Serinicoccus sp. LYQ131 TaxID=3378797 RepID=UPI003852068B
MSTTMSVPHVADLGPVLDTLAAWQTEGTPVQLHPGDLGWYWRHGAEATAAATRVWRRGSEVAAVGLLDGPDLLRLALAPHAQGDEALAHRVVGDLGDQTDEAVLRVEEVGPGQARAWCRVHRAAFGATGVSEDDLLQRWHRTTAGMPFAQARCLLGRDGRGDPVAGVIVWSAGPGRYGVLEPMGVHPEHRGRGHGVVATYTAAGFRRLPDRRDRRRAG